MVPENFQKKNLHLWPNLAEIQRKRYWSFIEKVMLKEIENIKDIESSDNNFKIEILSKDYKIVWPDKSWNWTKRNKQTYHIKIFVKTRITHVLKEVSVDVYSLLVKIPLMSHEGSFLINGFERVFVHQLVKSPGLFFKTKIGKQKSQTSIATLRPNRGFWLHFEIGKTELSFIKIGKNEQLLVYEFFRALGLSDYEIFQNLDISESNFIQPQPGQNLISSIDTEITNDEALIKFHKGSCSNDEIENYFNVIDESDSVEQNLNEFDEYDSNLEENIEYGFEQDSTHFTKDTPDCDYDYNEIDLVDNEEEKDAACFKDFYKKVENEDSNNDEIEDEIEDDSLEKSIEYIILCFFNVFFFDLSNTGRAKLDKKLGLTQSEMVTNFTAKDLLTIVKDLIKFRVEKTSDDDIDHLSNRRIKSVGDFLADQIRSSFKSLQRNLLIYLNENEKEVLAFKEIDFAKRITQELSRSVISNSLLQFMDQINCLASLTHIRRLSLLGPGGISPERASMGIRDIHPTQYGRICPIETSEGPAAGLIGAFSVYSRINDLGFIETPYYKVIKRKILSKVLPVYLDAETEENYHIAPGDVEIDTNGLIKKETVTVRYKRSFITVSSRKVEFIALSPIQIASMATALIPFFEHNDANRVLMGSNMQRQSVPLIYPEAPRVGTGMESILGYESLISTLSEYTGRIEDVSSSKITIKTGASNAISKSIMKYKRSNQETCITKNYTLSFGEKIQKGQVLNDGSSLDKGELAVGQNILVAYMPWEGYNYEDAFVISERLVFDNIFTSIHIENFEVFVRNTLWGDEKISKVLPYEMDLRGLPIEPVVTKLDENGIVRSGTWVTSGDILVGKVTPKPEEETNSLINREKLLDAIHERQFQKMKNTSFKVPNGISGRIIDIKIFSQESENAKKLLPSGVLKRIKISICSTRKIQVGDKVAGRHGNKGIVSKILPLQDMPFLSDGTPVDIILNPLGVPSRMNVGQLFETILGLSAEHLNARFIVAPFDEMYGVEASRALINRKWKELATMKPNIFTQQNPGKAFLKNGQTGQLFDNEITIGSSYMLKLIHLVDDKIHARSTDSYSLVTEQPPAGRARKGGQRLGEMEVWALEAFGAAYTLQELLTIKSDDIQGRLNTWKAILEGKTLPKPGLPEALKLLISELKGLCLEISFSKTDEY